MLDSSRTQYAFIRACIFLLQSIVPLSIAHSIYEVLFSTPWHLHLSPQGVAGSRSDVLPRLPAPIPRPSSERRRPSTAAFQRRPARSLHAFHCQRHRLRPRATHPRVVQGRTVGRDWEGGGQELAGMGLLREQDKRRWQ